MPSTIGWLAVAVAAGAMVGLAIGHWATVTGWLHRLVEDPVPPTDDRDRPIDERLGRMS